MSGQYMRAEYSLFSEEFDIKTAISRNGGNGRSRGTFLFIISASSVFSVAMTTNWYHVSRFIQIARQRHRHRRALSLACGGYLQVAATQPQNAD